MDSGTMDVQVHVQAASFLRATGQNEDAIVTVMFEELTFERDGKYCLWSNSKNPTKVIKKK